MCSKYVKSIITSLVIAAFLLTLIPGALAFDGASDGSRQQYGMDRTGQQQFGQESDRGMSDREQYGMDGYGYEKYGKTGDSDGKDKYDREKEIDKVYVPMTITGMTDGSVIYTVNEKAITMGDNKVAIMTFDTPQEGEYNLTKSMGFAEMPDKTDLNIRVTRMDNASLNVSGASSIICMGDIKKLYKGEDYMLFEAGSMALFMPDGTVKAYKLEQPVKIIYSKTRDATILDAYPTFTQALVDSFRGGDRFPGDMKVSLSSLENALQQTEKTTLRYTQPQELRVPTS